MTANCSAGGSASACRRGTRRGSPQGRETGHGEGQDFRGLRRVAAPDGPPVSALALAWERGRASVHRLSREGGAAVPPRPAAAAYRAVLSRPGAFRFWRLGRPVAGRLWAYQPLWPRARRDPPKPGGREAGEREVWAAIAAARDSCREGQWCSARAAFPSAHSCNASGNGKPNSKGIARPWNHCGSGGK